MEITYDTIIQHLVKNNNNLNKNKFINKKHLITYSNLFPEKFTETLQNKFYRYGVLQTCKNENISFYSSIITLLNKTFITFSEIEEIACINTFKNDMSNKIQEHEFSEEIKNYINKNKIDKKNIVNKIDILLIQCVCEVLDNNLIIFDFKNMNVHAVYPDSCLNPFKSTLLLANWNDVFEPIIYDVNSKRIFTYNDIYIKKFYSTFVFEYYQGNVISKDYQLRDNLKEIVNEIIVDTVSEELSEESVSESNEKNSTFIKTEYTDVQLNKMNKTQLFEIIKNKKIENTNTKMLKGKLIEIILNN
jgi:hypothetical protein